MSPWAAGAVPAVPSPKWATKAPAGAPLGLDEVAPVPGGLPTAGIPLQTPALSWESIPANTRGVSSVGEARCALQELAGGRLGFGLSAFLLPFPGAGKQPSGPGWC